MNPQRSYASVELSSLRFRKGAIPPGGGIMSITDTGETAVGGPLYIDTLTLGDTSYFTSLVGSAIDLVDSGTGATGTLTYSAPNLLLNGSVVGGGGGGGVTGDEILLTSTGGDTCSIQYDGSALNISAPLQLNASVINFPAVGLGSAATLTYDGTSTIIVSNDFQVVGTASLGSAVIVTGAVITGGLTVDSITGLSGAPAPLTSGAIVTGDIDISGGGIVFTDASGVTGALTFTSPNLYLNGSVVGGGGGGDTGPTGPYGTSTFTWDTGGNPDAQPLSANTIVLAPSSYSVLTVHSVESLPKSPTGIVFQCSLPEAAGNYGDLLYQIGTTHYVFQLYVASGSGTPNQLVLYDTVAFCTVGSPITYTPGDIATLYFDGSSNIYAYINGVIIAGFPYPDGYAGSSEKLSIATGPQYISGSSTTISNVAFYVTGGVGEIGPSGAPGDTGPTGADGIGTSGVWQFLDDTGATPSPGQFTVTGDSYGFNVSSTFANGQDATNWFAVLAALVASATPVILSFYDITNTSVVNSYTLASVTYTSGVYVLTLPTVLSGGFSVTSGDSVVISYTAVGPTGPTGAGVTGPAGPTGPLGPTGPTSSATFNSTILTTPTITGGQYQVYGTGTVSYSDSSHFSDSSKTYLINGIIDVFIQDKSGTGIVQDTSSTYAYLNISYGAGMGSNYSLANYVLDYPTGFIPNNSQGEGPAIHVPFTYLLPGYAAPFTMTATIQTQKPGGPGGAVYPSGTTNDQLRVVMTFQYQYITF